MCIRDSISSAHKASEYIWDSEVFEPRFPVSSENDTILGWNVYNLSLIHLYCTSKSPCAHIGAVLWKLNQLTIDHYPFHYAKPAVKEQREQREKSRQLRDVAREMHLQAQRRHQIAVSHGLIYHHKQLYQKRIDAFLENTDEKIRYSGRKKTMLLTIDIGTVSYTHLERMRLYRAECTRKSSKAWLRILK